MSDDPAPHGPPAVSLLSLNPLPYQDDIVRCLRSHEPEVWRWASSAQARAEQAEAVRGELLKETYRLDAAAHPALHTQCAAAAQRLGLQVPVTLYQAGDGEMNASLYYLPGEAHVVFAGPVLERLNEAELQALLGHELSHHLLWERDGGQYHTADRVLTAACHDPRARASHHQTARRFRLYTEAFADRGAAIAAGALAPAVTALVKTQTGLASVSADSYLQQADEICASNPAGTSPHHSHPELFVRARALRLWWQADPAADAWLRQVLEGPLSLDTLDLPGQQRLTDLTRQVLTEFLRPEALRSDALLTHARRFFPDFEAAPAGTDAPGDDADLATLVAASPGIHDYLSAVLLDFATADPALDDVPLAAAFELSRRLALEAAFDPFALKTLKRPLRQFNHVKQEAGSLLRQAAAEPSHDD